MKVSFTKSLLLAFAAVAMLAACHKQEPSRVGLNATAPSFVDGKVDIIVSLSAAAETNVGITLAASGTIPQSALTFEKNPTIAAGKTAVTVPVTVDASSLEPGNYQATFTIASVTGADINTAKQSATVDLAVEAVAVVPEVSFSAYSEAFVDGKATISLALSQAIDSDVVVNFAVEEEMEGYELVPASALTFSNPVTIPAGSTSLEVNVAVDESVLESGVSYFAVISLSSVSENAKIAATKTKTYIEAKKNLAANARTDWSASYAGEQTDATSGDISSVIAVSGVQGGYYTFVYSKGVVAEEFESITEYLVYMEEKAIGPAIGTANAYKVKTGDANWLYNRFDVGEYELWVLGCTEAGHLTGDYAHAEFSVAPSAAMVSAYDNWLGDWFLGRTAVTIEEKNRSEVSFTIKAGDIFIDANLGWDGELQFFVTDPCTTAGGQGFFGYYPAEEEGYINIYSGSAAIGRAILDGTLKAANVESTNNGYFTGMATFRYNSEGQITGWGDLDIEFPVSMTRPPESLDENYVKWLGTWNVEGFANPLTIAQDVPNESFTIGLFYPSISVTYAIVDFNAETGGLEFNFGQAGGAVTSGGNNYTLYLSGITNDGYVATGSTTVDLLATAALDAEGKTATITENHYTATRNDAPAEVWPVSLGLLGYNSSAGWSNFGMLFNIPTTMTKQAEEAAGAPAVRSSHMQSIPAGTKVRGEKLRLRIANPKR